MNEDRALPTAACPFCGCPRTFTRKASPNLFGARTECVCLECGQSWVHVPTPGQYRASGRLAGAALIAAAAVAYLVLYAIRHDII